MNRSRPNQIRPRPSELGVEYGSQHLKKILYGNGVFLRAGGENGRKGKACASLNHLFHLQTLQNLW